MIKPLSIQKLAAMVDAGGGQTNAATYSRDLVNNRNLSPKGYRYTYANPREVGPLQPMQYEFWQPKGRKGGQWIVSDVPHYGSHKTWRKVFPGHSHADKLAHSIARIRDVRDPFNTVQRQCETYTAWAASAGLQSVAVFAGHDPSKDAAKLARLVGRPVLVADFIGEAPFPEVCDE